MEIKRVITKTPKELAREMGLYWSFPIGRDKFMRDLAKALVEEREKPSRIDPIVLEALKMARKIN